MPPIPSAGFPRCRLADRPVHSIQVAGDRLIRQPVDGVVAVAHRAPGKLRDALAVPLCDVGAALWITPYPLRPGQVPNPFPASIWDDFLSSSFLSGLCLSISTAALFLF